MALCFALFYWHLGLLPFYTRGESREALVVWEMVRTGDWILPRINGDYIPYKPPLFHWFGALLGITTGRVDEFTVRFPSAFFATCGVLMIYFTGARLWSKKAGLISAVVLATATEWWNSAVIAQVDMTLAFFMTAGLLYFYRTYQERRSGIGSGALLGALLGCATLAKGPLGVAVPGLVIVVFLVLRRDIRFLEPVYVAAAATAFIVVAGSWYFAAWREGGWAFIQRQIVEENFGTAKGVSGHYQPSIYFVRVYLLNFLPLEHFSPFDRLVYIQPSGEACRNGQLLFPLAWFVSVLLFFTASAGKRGVYILPLYPAAALLFGAWWAELEASRPSDRVAAVAGYCLGGSVLFAVIIGLAGILDPATAKLKPFIIIADFFRALAPLSPLSWSCLVMVALSALVVCVFLKHNRWTPVFFALGLMTAVSAIFLEAAYYPAFAAQRTLKPFIERVSHKIGHDAPLFFYDLFDFGAVFYSRRHIPFYAQSEASRRPVYLLMREDDWRRLSAGTRLERLDISEGGGPTGRHRVVLAEGYETSPEKSLPLGASGPSDADLSAE